MAKKTITTKEEKSGSTKKAVNMLAGVVVSNKMDKTVVVSVSRFIKHPKYGKFYKVSKKYKAHDEENQYQVGDNVSLKEVKPISKDKKFIVVSK
jgi:small subunit ribosomal protein S17